MADLLHIALLVETSREYGRGLLRGVARYHHEHGPWSIYFEPHGLNEPPPAWLKNWRGDGCLPTHKFVLQKACVTTVIRWGRHN
jgi:LacI family transcriptional regulator